MRRLPSGTVAATAVLLAVPLLPAPAHAQRVVVRRRRKPSHLTQPRRGAYHGV